MKSATISELKKDLQQTSKEELLDLCLRLAKFKKENKELLTYLLYEASDEEAFIAQVKEEIDELFFTINRDSYYFMKKSVQKILRQVKKHIRYSKITETEVALLLYFCEKVKNMTPHYTGSKIIVNLYERQLILIEKSISKLHEDLQYDYNRELENLLS